MQEISIDSELNSGMFGVEFEKVSERIISWHWEKVNKKVQEIIWQVDDGERGINQNDGEGMWEDNKKVQWHSA